MDWPVGDREAVAWWSRRAELRAVANPKVGLRVVAVVELDLPNLGHWGFRAIPKFRVADAWESPRV